MAFWLPVGILLLVAGIAMWVGVRHPPRHRHDERN
jgi:hypothetical protein